MPSTKTSIELEQRTRELSALLTLSEALGSLRDLSNLDNVLSSALDSILEVMRVAIGGILLLDETGETLCYRAYRGLSSQYVRQMCLRLGEGIAGKVARNGEAMLLEDISNTPDAARPKLISTEGLRAFASVPIRSESKVLGVLNIASHEPRLFSTEDVRLLETIARQLATAIENARLHEEVRRKDEIRQELLREVLSIQEEERRRIARELHDEISQSLISLNTGLEVVSSSLPPGAEKTSEMIRKTQHLSISILDEIHRVIYELRPTLLDDLGLVAATRWLLDNKLGGAGVKVDFRTIGREKRLFPQLEATLFRVIQEAATNIARHAHAKNAHIILHFKKDTVNVSVKDDGVGFDVQEAISSQQRPRGLGLLGMKERVELVNGTLTIQSSPLGGTEISFQVPLGREVSHV